MEAKTNNNRPVSKNTSKITRSLSSQNMNTSSTDSLSDNKKSKKGGRLSKITNMFKKDSKKNKNERVEDDEEVFYDAYAEGSDRMTTEQSQFPRNPQSLMDGTDVTFSG